MVGSALPVHEAGGDGEGVSMGDGGWAFHPAQEVGWEVGAGTVESEGFL